MINIKKPLIKKKYLKDFFQNKVINNGKIFEWWLNNAIKAINFSEHLAIFVWHKIRDLQNKLDNNIKINT